MKRSLLLSHGEDQQVQAKKKRQKHHDDTSNDVSRTESTGHTKSNDGRLCLLSLVCNQQLSTNKEKVSRVKPQVQGNPTKIPQEGDSDSDSEETNKEGLSKNAQQVLGILSPVVASLSEDENENQRPALIRGEEESNLNNKKATTTCSNDEGEGMTKEDNNPILKQVCRPIPLPPRLPMVPAGHIFPLARFLARN